MTKIALAAGYWSQNIGNAFFQLGAQGLLESVTGDSPKMIADIPAHWTLHRKSSGNPQNWWMHLQHIDADFFVFEGPELTRNVEVMWDDVLPMLAAQGIEPVMLSVSFSHYSSEELDAAKRLIDRHKISKIVTRDNVTARLLAPYADVTPGICSAWFLPWAVSPLSLKQKFVVSCFETWPESIKLIDDLLAGSTVDPDDYLKPRWLKRQSVSYLWSLGRRPYRAESVGELDIPIVRTIHRSNPAVMPRLFKDKNIVVSDEPYTYLSLYSSAQLVVTDRVHAAVAALAYGVPAFLLSASPRSNLFEAVGVSTPMYDVCRVDQAELERARHAHRENVAKTLGL